MDETRPMQAREHLPGDEAEAVTPVRGAGKTLWGSLLAGIAASACCAGPLLLLSLGLGGSWLSTFSKLEPLRPLFIAVALLFLGLTYRKLYVVPRQCQEGTACALDPGLKVQRRIFWITTVVVLAVITFPWWGVPLLDE